MAIRRSVIHAIVDIFKRHGAETIDTPTFEMLDLLGGKYGEEGGKLIYTLDDHGGELYGLRYDLTVPLARYLAMNRQICNLKRYQIAKVYRRDNPVMTKGRFREFYQCVCCFFCNLKRLSYFQDFDIAGEFANMVPEAECFRIIFEVFEKLDIGEFEIRVNHRKLLEGLFVASQIDPKDFKTVCSSIDKLDKQPWTEVYNELTVQKRIEPAFVDRLEKDIRLRHMHPDKDNNELLEELLLNLDAADENIKNAVDDIKKLLRYSEIYGVPNIIFDPSLARGLDYYTGVIYEVVMKSSPRIDKSDDSISVGSVAAGGRYDNLVENLGGRKVPCCGVSFGIERLFCYVKAKMNAEGKSIRTTETEVFVASAQKDMLNDRMSIIRDLWDSGIKAEMSMKSNPKLLDQLQYCEKNLIPIAIIIGQRELAEGIVKIRNVATREEVSVKSGDMFQEVTRKLDKLNV